jgi:hypothetical protein
VFIGVSEESSLFVGEDISLRDAIRSYPVSKGHWTGPILHTVYRTRALFRTEFTYYVRKITPSRLNIATASARAAAAYSAVDPKITAM